MPHILNVKVEIDKITTQEVKSNFFSKTNIQCNNVVNANQKELDTRMAAFNWYSQQLEIANMEQQSWPQRKPQQKLQTLNKLCLN